MGRLAPGMAATRRSTAYLGEPVPTVPQPRPGSDRQDRTGPWLFTRADFFQGPAPARPSSSASRPYRGRAAPLIPCATYFAVKFYIRHGNYDLVGDNMPVLFIQDAATFPDFVHA